VLLEHLEGIGQEPHLVPHPGLSSEMSVMPFAGADGLHLCAAVAFGTQHRAFQMRRLGRIDMQRNAVLTHRQDAARVQDLGAAGAISWASS